MSVSQIKCKLFKIFFFFDIFSYDFDNQIKAFFGRLREYFLTEGAPLKLHGDDNSY